MRSAAMPRFSSKILGFISHVLLRYCASTSLVVELIGGSG